jgi:hypothetical protein
VDQDLAGRIRALAEEYVQLVDAMRGGQYADEGEWQQLSSQRMLVHDELIELTGVTDHSRMYAFCRDMLADRQPG